MFAANAKVVCAASRHDENAGARPRGISKKVAVIGAGPSGLVCARELLREGHQVSLFEKASQIGGTWNLDAIPAELQRMSVGDERWETAARSVHSSLYEELRTNLPREIMSYSDFPFDANFDGASDTRRFCDRHEVRAYLEAFAEWFDLKWLIQFNSAVMKLFPTEREALKWDMEVESNGETQLHQFDGVVVATGHNTAPNVPKIKNIEKFEPPRFHSHLYRNAKPFKDQTVVIHGSAYSARDLALEIGQTGKCVYVCGRSWPKNADLSKPTGARKNVHFLPDIAECTAASELRLTNGAYLKDVDCLVYCTGYLYEFPFLEKTGLVTTEGNIVYPLYKRVFHPRQPTLAFITLPNQILSFVTADYQSKCIARVFSGRSQLPTVEDMIAETDRSIEEFKKENKPTRLYNFMLFSQFAYHEELCEICGDVPSMPKWREDMLKATIESMYANPETFRDAEMQDPCFEVAEAEFKCPRALSAVGHERPFWFSPQAHLYSAPSTGGGPRSTTSVLKGPAF